MKLDKLQLSEDKIWTRKRTLDDLPCHYDRFSSLVCFFNQVVRKKLNEHLRCFHFEALKNIFFYYSRLKQRAKFKMYVKFDRQHQRHVDCRLWFVDCYFKEKNLLSPLHVVFVGF